MKYHKDTINLSHGSGGKQMHRLLDDLIISKLDNEILRKKQDSAILDIGSRKIAFTTDSYVVNPIFFPGGDIGSLAIYGTVNDLSVCGARPLYISLGLIIEEGLDRGVLERVLRSVADSAKRTHVKVVTGDTKVVERGSCDKIFINTSGIGEIYYDRLSADRIRPGDAVLVSGPIGDHAISVLSKRAGIAFKTAVKSDSAPLHDLISSLLKRSKSVKFMRDPTRGGVATTLNEICQNRYFGIEIDETEIPVRPGVRQACELLGLEPLYLACEGRVVVITSAGSAKTILDMMRAHRSGRLARSIGTVSADAPGKVYVRTPGGGRRMADMMSGEQLPRIC